MQLSKNFVCITILLRLYNLIKKENEASTLSIGSRMIEMT